jgi:hypothetical protein
MCNKIKGFEESFQEFINSRSLQDLSYIIIEDAEYIKLDNEVDNHIAELLTTMPETQKQEFTAKLDNVVSAFSAVEATAIALMYMQGIREGVKLGGILRDDEQLTCADCPKVKEVEPK